MKLNETDLLHLVELKEDISNMDFEELQERKELYKELLGAIILYQQGTMFDIQTLFDMVVKMKCFEANCDDTEENHKKVVKMERKILDYLRGNI